MTDHNRSIWFGTARNARWIKAPLTGMNASGNGSAEEQQFTNGGQFVRASFGSARTFEMSWVGERSELEVIKSYKDGIYGGGLVYWEDPFADNILPPHWAAPMLTVRDWPSLISSGNKPEPVTHSTEYHNYPYQSAKYSVTNTEEPQRSVTLLIPEGHTLYVGFLYTKTGTASMWYVPIYNDGTEGAPQKLYTADPGASQPYSRDFIYDADGSGLCAVRIFIAREDSIPSTITIRGGIARYHSSFHWHTAVGDTYEWSSGEGSSGCVMSIVPSMTYNGVLDGRRLINMSVTLKEIGAWL